MFAVLGGSSLLLALAIAPFALLDGFESFFTSSLGTLILYGLQYVFALFVLMIIPFIQAGGRWRLLIPDLGLTRLPKFMDILYAVPAWVLYFAASLITLTIIGMLVPGINLDQEQQVGFDGVSLPYEYVLAFIALAVLPPLAEEMIFRGYLFGRMREKYGFWLSAVITSLVFGIVHMQLNVGIDVFVLSIFLCYLREKTGSIWAPIFLHSLKNSVAYVFLFVLK